MMDDFSEDLLEQMTANYGEEAKLKLLSFCQSQLLENRLAINSFIWLWINLNLYKIAKNICPKSD